MAKAKKKQLSLDEMLEQAIIKEEDRPYEVPENWVWTKLDNVAEYKKGPFGSAITKAMFIPKGENTYKIYEQGNAIRKDKNYGTYYISEEKYQELKGFTVYPNDLIVSCAGTVGEVYQLPENIETGIINQALMRIKVSEKVNLKYYLLYFSESLKVDITGKSKGTAIKNIPPFAILKNMPFPLPPTVEQQRIADIIDQLFEKLDTAKELVQNALDSFENRKAAILHKAFTGELTAKWREENGVSLDEWEERSLGKVCKSIFDGDHMPPPKSEEGVPFLVISNINKGYLNFENTRFVPKKYYDKISDTRKPQLGDILYSIVGSYGIPVLVDDEREFCFQRHMALLKPLQIESKLLFYLLQTTNTYNQVTQIATGTAQLTVPIKGLREIKFLLPPQLEQKEIVRILDNLLDNEQYAKELCDVIEKIDLMKKAILAKAFRGELGTNNPKEESAVQLLKEVLKEKL